MSIWILSFTKRSFESFANCFRVPYILLLYGCCLYILETSIIIYIHISICIYFISTLLSSLEHTSLIFMHLCQSTEILRVEKDENTEDYWKLKVHLDGISLKYLLYHDNTLMFVGQNPILRNIFPQKKSPFSFWP